MQTQTSPCQKSRYCGQDDVHLRAHHVLHPEGALDGAEDDGGVARVFVDLLPAALSFLHHGLERGDDAAQELEDDRGRDVGHDPQAEDRAHADRGAAEHGHGAEELARGVGALLLLPVPELGLVDDRQGDVEADPVDGQEHGREQDLPPQLGDLEDRQSLSTAIVSPRPSGVSIGQDPVTSLAAGRTASSQQPADSGSGARPACHPSDNWVRRSPSRPAYAAASGRDAGLVRRRPWTVWPVVGHDDGLAAGGRDLARRPSSLNLVAWTLERLGQLRRRPGS